MTERSRGGDERMQRFVDNDRGYLDWRPDHLGIDDMPPKVWVNRILQECAEAAARGGWVLTVSPDV